MRIRARNGRKALSLMLALCCAAGSCAPRTPKPAPAMANSEGSSVKVATEGAPSMPGSAGASANTRSVPSQPAVSVQPEEAKATRAQAAGAPALKEFAPGVRLNVAEGYVEFDAKVPLNARDPEKPRIYLEVIACTPDTKEHEAVLLTKARPSHVHAALLLLGLEPGSPGVWDWSGEKLNAIPPKGPRVRIAAYYIAGSQDREANPSDWVIDAITRKTLTETAGEDHWVFAGSQMYQRQGQDYYRADADGTLIGLTTFGGETIAWSRMYNPDSEVEAPHWIANAATLPDYNTPVVVRISKERDDTK